MLRLYSLEDLQKCGLDKWGLVDPTERRQDVDEEREDSECSIGGADDSFGCGRHRYDSHSWSGIRLSM